MNKTQRNSAQVEFELLEEGGLKKEHPSLGCQERFVVAVLAVVLTRVEN